MWPTKEKYAQMGAFSTSFGTHDEISQVSTVPIDALNAKILELSVRMIPYFSAVVRKKTASTENSRISRLFREAQGKPFL